MVAGYTCEEVVNKKAHDFIVEDAVSFVSEAQNYCELCKQTKFTVSLNSLLLN
jgi:hypothetical protein